MSPSILASEAAKATAVVYIQKKDTAMIEVQPSPAELASGHWESAQVSRAKQALEEDGIVVLKDVANPAHLVAIRNRMLEDVDQILTRPDVPFNFNQGNLQQDPPPFSPYLFRDVLLNDLVIEVTHSILGDGLYNSFYSGNTVLARSVSRQPVHADMGHLWPNMAAAAPAYAYVVNFPLVDMDASNGSTEMWPGSHLDTSCAFQDGDIKIAEAKLEVWRRARPPVQPKVELGSAVIRDIRMWHAGMPNPSGAHRPMVAMIHWVSWWPKDRGVPFPAASRDFFEHPVLWTNADFREEPIDHTSHGHAYEFQESK